MGTAHKRLKRLLRRGRVRAKILGRADRPRISVFRSNAHVWVQVIDDAVGRTLVSASDRDAARSEKRPKSRDVRPRIAVARRVGEIAAERARKIGIQSGVFDRGGYRYHGIIRAVAEGARSAGLKL